MKARKVKTPQIKIGEVHPDHSSFQVKLELIFDWDWNRDIAGEFSKQLDASFPTLINAIQADLADQVFNSVEGAVSSVQITSANFTPAMVEAFNEYKKNKQEAAQAFKTEAERIEFQKALEIVNRYIAK